MSNHSAAGIAALPDAEKKAVQEQLERLLGNPHFSQSRRFPSFLRFVIGQTLIGQPELLKERTLGIEIFGRDADYDTASDPIVRVTATEIRKRIAQGWTQKQILDEMVASFGPGVLSTPISPPISSIKRRAIDNPSPVPPKRRVVDASA